MVIIVMGVSGSGKTATGSALARAVGWTFLEGDNYHPPGNIEKMRHGQPLNDADRAPWLERLRILIAEQLEQDKDTILACSALQHEYRQFLQVNADHVRFVFLKGDFDLIHRRLKKRHGHFMTAGLLASQFEALEPPRDAFTLNIAEPVVSLVAKIRQQFDI